MDITFIINLSVLTLTILTPFIALYAISFIKKQDYETHIKIQKRLFFTCVTALIVLELQIRLAGGSGSLVANGTYTQTVFFKSILIAHIIGAILTYLLWGATVFISARKRKTTTALPGKFSRLHKRLGYLVVAGLIYTAITASVVYVFAFVL